MNGQPDGEAWSGRTVTVTGGAGFLGGHLVPALEGMGAAVRVIRSSEHDLRDPGACADAVADAHTVFHLAATVGGIGFNLANPGPLVYDNLAMAANVFEQSRLAGVSKLVAPCSVCAYPKETPVPFREDAVWDGYPEESNAPYGTAKRMLLVLSQAYRDQYGFESCAPLVTNLYGPGDNFDLESSHVLGAMVRKFVEAAGAGAPAVTLWGSGIPTREFLHAADCARGLILAAERLRTSEPVNLGSGRPVAIRDLAHLVAGAAGFDGDIVWDTTRPDGQMERHLDVARARELIGFEATIPLDEGIGQTVASFRASRS